MGTLSNIQFFSLLTPNLVFIIQWLVKFLYIAICIRDWWWVHEVYGAIFRGLISHTATQLATFIFHACGSVTPGSPLMWQEEAQTRMRQREREKAEGWQKVKQSTMEKGVWDFYCGVGFLEGWEDGMWECKETGMSLQGAARNQWSHHLTDLWGFALRAGRRWVGRKEAGLRGKGSGDGGGLGEGMMVAWADRDISAASVISRRLAAARGHRWAHESTGTW